MARLEAEARAKLILERAEKSRELRERLSSPVGVEEMEFFPQALKPLKFVESPGQEGNFAFRALFTLRGPGIVSSKDIFESHVRAFLRAMEKQAEAYFAARGFTNISLDNWDVIAEKRIVKVRAWEVFEVLPNEAERPLGKDYIGRKKLMLEKATALARTTGLVHRLWPIVRSRQRWGGEEPERPRDEFIEVSPSGDVVSQRLAEPSSIPEEPEPEGT